MEILYKSNQQLDINTNILASDVKSFKGSLVEKEFEKLNKKYSSKYNDSSVYKDFINHKKVWIIRFTNSKTIYK